MEITKKHTAPAETILILSGQLNFMVRKDFKAAIQDAQAEETQHIILDLTHASFIDCSAIGVLVRAKEDLAKTQTRLSLIAGPGRVFDVLQIMHLDEMIPIVFSKYEA